ncbi:hypothetical protein MUK42_21731 [Musa troglodytarum]|uniref:Uncharacterized protein n=1 Tax=Musa troglodytarum TaxID=320322 RepID=A0A9E7KCI6_9LILI|nr:hypothetical protein MUK42_21731 [Musa troglodytarum]
MTREKLHMLKHAVQLLVSSLGPRDRLFVIAFLVILGIYKLRRKTKSLFGGLRSHQKDLKTKSALPMRDKAVNSIRRAPDA